MKKIIIAGIIVILVLVTVFFAASGHLRVKYPEYYNLDTFKGIEVYVWQNEDGEYRCGAMSGTNRGKTIEELIALTDNSTTIDEMKKILKSYKSERDSIAAAVLLCFMGILVYVKKRQSTLVLQTAGGAAVTESEPLSVKEVETMIKDSGETVPDTLTQKIMQKIDNAK